jgi:TctA family transporter
MVEEQFRRTLLLSDGDFSIFLTRPLSATLIGVTAVLLLLMALPSLRKSREEAFREQD